MSQIQNEELRPVAESIAADPEVYAQVEELLKMKASNSSTGVTLESVRPGQGTGVVLEAIFDTGQPRVGGGVQLDIVRDVPDLPDDRMQLEAIVRTTGRPPLLVQNDDWTYEMTMPVVAAIRSRLDAPAVRSRLQPRIKSVGRIERVTAGGQPAMVGTGWLIEKNVMVTNSHVAGQFARATSDQTSFQMTLTDEQSVRADLKREYSGTDELLIAITKILWMAPKDSPLDIAFLRVDKLHSDLPDPLQPAEDNVVAKQQHVVTIGYPAEDANNDRFHIRDYFGSTFEVKRLSPGMVTETNDLNWIEHDCTTLGGSSGSPVIGLEDGQVVGLHFSGGYQTRNLAVKISHVKKKLLEVITQR